MTRFRWCLFISPDNAIMGSARLCRYIAENAFIVIVKLCHFGIEGGMESNDV